MSESARKHKTGKLSTIAQERRESHPPVHDHSPLTSGGGGGHHGEEEGGEGNWLVSYADMMTLLVGFFAIMLSFSVMDQEKFEEARKSVTEEFGGTFQIPFGDFADRLREMVTKAGLGDQFVVKQTPAGVEISFHGTVFFQTGSADLKPEAQALLQQLIPVIKNEGTDFDITVEGHTDDVPISSGVLFRNNWELSSLRACRVIDSFSVAGFPMSRLTAVGYGEARPIVPNRDKEGKAIPENQSQNRRVVIKVLKRNEPSLGGSGTAAASAKAAPSVPSEAPADVSSSAQAEPPVTADREPASSPSVN